MAQTPLDFLPHPCYSTFVPDTHLMPDTLSRNIYRALFSDDQWDLIYAMSGHALDNDDFTPEDVYSIRNKIHALFDHND